jgi:ISXO2-like transposase domain
MLDNSCRAMLNEPRRPMCKQRRRQHWYSEIGREFATHSTVNHAADEYVNRKTGATTNKAENFFSQLKRSLDGTFHHVSKDHLPRYLVEFDYRYSHRRISDTARMEHMVGRIEGRRLTYKRTKTA